MGATDIVRYYRTIITVFFDRFPKKSEKPEKLLFSGFLLCFYLLRPAPPPRELPPPPRAPPKLRLPPEDGLLAGLLAGRLTEGLLVVGLPVPNPPEGRDPPKPPGRLLPKPPICPGGGGGGGLRYLRGVGMYTVLVLGRTVLPPITVPPEERPLKEEITATTMMIMIRITIKRPKFQPPCSSMGDSLEEISSPSKLNP